MAEGITLRVTPERLQEKAGEITSLISEMKQHFDEIDRISVKTGGYWLGEAGSKDREEYAAMKDDIAHLEQRLSEHPKDLLTMAGIYTDAETTVADTNSQLSTDLIV